MEGKDNFYLNGR